MSGEVPAYSRADLEQLQLARLQDTLARAYAHVPHYRHAFDQAGVRPGDVTSLADLGRLPFTFAGLVLSTLLIAFVDNHTKNRLVILFAQLLAFGVLWVLRFFLLDKLFHVEIYEDDTPDPV